MILKKIIHYSKIIVFCTLLLPQALQSSDPMITAINAGNLAEVQKLYASDPSVYGALVYTKKIVAKFGPNWQPAPLATGNGGGGPVGGVIVQRTQAVINMQAEFADILATASDGATAAQMFNTFINKIDLPSPKLNADQLTQINDAADKIAGSYTPPLMLDKTKAAYRLMTPATPPPPPPGPVGPPPPPGPVGPPPPPPPFGPPPPLPGPLGPIKPLLPTKASITFEMRKAEIDDTQKALTAKLSSGIPPIKMKDLALDARMITTIVKPSLKLAVDIVTAVSSDQTLIDLLNNNATAFDALVIPQTLFDKTSKATVSYSFLTSDPDCSLLAGEFDRWANNLTATSSALTAAQKKLISNLKDAFSTFATGLKKVKLTYSDFAYIFDSGQKAYMQRLAIVYPTLLGNYANITTARDAAIAAYNSVEKAIQAEVQRLAADPTMMSDKKLMLTTLETFEETLVKSGTALDTTIKDFKRLTTEYTLPTDKASYHIINVVNGTATSSSPVAIAAPSTATLAVVNPDTLPAYQNPADRLGILYPGLASKYLKSLTPPYVDPRTLPLYANPADQVGAVYTGMLALFNGTSAPTTGTNTGSGTSATDPAKGAADNLTLALLRDKLYTPMTESQDFFNSFLKEYTTTGATISPIAPNVITGKCRLPEQKVGVTEEVKEKNIFLIVGQDPTTGKFPNSPSDSVLIYDRPESPFIVAEDNVIATEPLLATRDTAGVLFLPINITGFSLTIGFLKDGYEIPAPISTSATSPDLGRFERFLPATASTSAAGIQPKKNTTNGYDLYVWGPDLTELSGTTAEENKTNLYRLYTADIQKTVAPDRTAKDFLYTPVIRLNNNCFVNTPPKKTRLYKLYSYVAKPADKPRFGVGTPEYPAFGPIPKETKSKTANDFIWNVYNKCIDKLRIKGI